MSEWSTTELEQDACSLLTPAGYQRSSCGYCHSQQGIRSRTSVGFSSTSVQPSHYQTLVDRGWRRSGNYYYKPDNRNTCCPNYTIRLDAREFKPRKDQKRALHRWNRYVLGQKYREEAARWYPRSRQEKRKQRNVFDLCRSVHVAEYASLPFNAAPERQKHVIEPHARFEITLEPDNFTPEKYELFQNYQRVVHKEGPDKISMTGFKRFLCSGLGQFHTMIRGRRKLIGSFHQCYRLDGRLIAMGVLDLLPHAVSSVYLMYHEGFNEWEFGKISALREISLAIEEDYGFYYMGYYIHSCRKMRYKGDFRPTYLLDSITREWDLLDEDMRARLTARRFVSMHIERTFNLPITISEVDTKALSSTIDPSQLHFGNANYGSLLEYINSEDAQGSTRDAQSVFEAGTPGCLSVKQVRDECDLGRWKLVLGHALVDLEDLTQWDDSDLTDSHLLKGIAAELAASIGPELVRQSMLTLQF